MTEELKEKFMQYLTDCLRDFDYGDIDVFLLDNELDEEEENELFDFLMHVKVVEEYDSKINTK